MLFIHVEMHVHGGKLVTQSEVAQDGSKRIVSKLDASCKLDNQ